MNKFHQFLRKCKDVDESPILTALGYAKNRMIGKNILQASDVSIKGIERVQTSTNLLLIGMRYNGLMQKGDKGILNIRGRLEVCGDFSIGKGCRIDVGPKGIIRLEGGYINAMAKIAISDELYIGENCAISWDTSIIDNDFHDICYHGKREKRRGIKIGKNVWIGNQVSITKGAQIPDGCVVASNSLVNREFTKPNTLIGGIPAKVLKEDVSWN